MIDVDAIMRELLRRDFEPETSEPEHPAAALMGGSRVQSQSFRRKRRHPPDCLLPFEKGADFCPPASSVFRGEACLEKLGNGACHILIGLVSVYRLIILVQMDDGALSVLGGRDFNDVIEVEANWGLAADKMKFDEHGRTSFLRKGLDVTHDSNA